ncbi:hypothetical protein QJQ45_016155, partial [Haematococcus lacustris]
MCEEPDPMSNIVTNMRWLRGSETWRSTAVATAPIPCLLGSKRHTTEEQDEQTMPPSMPKQQQDWATASNCRARHIFIDTRGLCGLMSDDGMLEMMLEDGVTALRLFRNGALPDPAQTSNYIQVPKDSLDIPTMKHRRLHKGDVPWHVMLIPSTGMTREAAQSATATSSSTGKDFAVTVVAGGFSGAVAKTCVAPLARLTILYQARYAASCIVKLGVLLLSSIEVQALSPHGTAAPSLLSALLQVVWRQEGAASLWKGNLATIIHRVPYSATNFAVFEATKEALEPHMESDILRRLVAGGSAGLVACTAVGLAQHLSDGGLG